MRVIGFLIIILIILIILIGIIVFVLKYFKIPPTWPYIFNLTNKEITSRDIQVLINGKFLRKISLSPGKPEQILIGDNVIMPGSKVPLSKKDIFNITFQLLNDGSIEYTSPNVFQNPIFTTNNCVGPDCKITSSPGDQGEIYLFPKKGYYTIFLS